MGIDDLIIKRRTNIMKWEDYQKELKVLALQHHVPLSDVELFIKEKFSSFNEATEFYPDPDDLMLDFTLTELLKG